MSQLAEEIFMSQEAKEPYISNGAEDIYISQEVAEKFYMSQEAGETGGEITVLGISFNTSSNNKKHLNPPINHLH